MEHNSLGRLISVLISPTATFRSIAERPTWLLALFVGIVLSAGVMFLAVPKVDWEQTAREQIEQSSMSLTDEQREAQIEGTKKAGPVITYAAVVVMPWIIYPLMALIFMVLFKILGGDVGFKTSLSISVYGLVPQLLAWLLSIPVILGAESFTGKDLEGGLLAANLGAFVGQDAGPVVQAALTSLNVFSFWSIGLLALGYSIAAKVSMGRAVTGVTAMWIFWVAFKVGMAALGSAFGG